MFLFIYLLIGFLKINTKLSEKLVIYCLRELARRKTK